MGNNLNQKNNKPLIIILILALCALVLYTLSAVMHDSKTTQSYTERASNRAEDAFDNGADKAESAYDKYKQ